MILIGSARGNVAIHDMQPDATLLTREFIGECIYTFFINTFTGIIADESYLLTQLVVVLDLESIR